MHVFRTLRTHVSFVLQVDQIRLDTNLN